MTARTGGEWVVEALLAAGVRHVFGIPGVHNLAVYDALLRQAAIRHVLARHEQGAAFMADGYARASGRPGVVLVTTGPGATNTITPVAESHAASIPVLVLMSDIASDQVGRGLGALHEVPNQIDLFRSISRRAIAVTEARAIAGAVTGAFEAFATLRPGPIALSIPYDLLAARVESVVRFAPGERARCGAAEIAEAARLLGSATRPLLIAGGGVVAAQAGGELAGLARRLGAPVLTSVTGRGAIDEADPLWQGVLPNRRASADAIAAADVVLAVGCRFALRSTGGLLLNLSFAPHQTLIHLDLDPGVFGLRFKPELAIAGDARDGLARLLGALSPGAPSSAWDRRQLAGWRDAVSPRYTARVAAIVRALRAALPADAIVVNDQTGLCYWMEHHFPVRAPRTFLYPATSATLGYAVPAAVGAQVACPDRPVVAVAGDGGFMFSVNELATAVKYGLPIVFLVLNDGRYGAIKWLQETMFGRWGEADLSNPDFPALARAFGAAGERVDELAALPAAIARGLRRAGPSVVELPWAIDPPWDL
jgi:thiamine pyrophosphate-dependent acetolactate synthase large subunit-like protein